MAEQISENRVEALKRQATRLMRIQPELTRAMALDEVARQQGYANWSLLARSVIVFPQVARHGQHQIEFVARMRGRSPIALANSGWQETVTARHPARWYQKFDWIPERWIFESPDPRDLRHRVDVAKRAIGFMDATGLRSAGANKWNVEKQFGGGLPDHLCVWRDEARRYLATAEPYIGEIDAIPHIAEWCQQHAWQWRLLPIGCGIWNPCGENCPPHCTRHTQMILLAPMERGADIQAAEQAWGSPRYSFDATASRCAPPIVFVPRAPSISL